MSGTAVPLRPVRRGTLIKLWAGIALTAVAAGALAWTGTASTIAANGTVDQYLAWNARQSGVVTTASGLQYRVIEAGEGETPTDADVVLVNYKGALRDGKVFDQAERAPFPVDQVVPGFSEGMKLMPKGAKYRFWIPPQLGYGDAPQGDAIPANSLLCSARCRCSSRCRAAAACRRARCLRGPAASKAASGRHFRRSPSLKA